MGSNELAGFGCGLILSMLSLVLAKPMSLCSRMRLDIKGQPVYPEFKIFEGKIYEK